MPDRKDNPEDDVIRKGKWVWAELSSAFDAGWNFKLALRELEVPSFYTEFEEQIRKARKKANE